MNFTTSDLSVEVSYTLQDTLQNFILGLGRSFFKMIRKRYEVTWHQALFEPLCCTRAFVAAPRHAEITRTLATIMRSDVASEAHPQSQFKACNTSCTSRQ